MMSGCSFDQYDRFNDDSDPMESLSVVSIGWDGIVFNNGVKLYSDHESSCCEVHELTLSDLRLSDFEGLKFNLTNGLFLNRIPEYGIELIPLEGHSVKIPGHGWNNGYYSDNLWLVIEKDGDVFESYDITECQKID
jgi:hypothetical protein